MEPNFSFGAGGGTGESRVSPHLPGSPIFLALLTTSSRCFWSLSAATACRPESFAFRASISDTTSVPRLASAFGRLAWARSALKLRRSSRREAAPVMREARLLWRRALRVAESAAEPCGAFLAPSPCARFPAAQRRSRTFCSSSPASSCSHSWAQPWAIAAALEERSQLSASALSSACAMRLSSTVRFTKASAASFKLLASILDWPILAALPIFSARMA
mmetsp:Transcript_53638/g.122344  ORF Transcript_53638/g.122344 Transcript_53638/m.122344 type:complete len:219 (-) Transcript_53638:79-735(-)